MTLRMNDVLTLLLAATLAGTLAGLARAGDDDLLPRRPIPKRAVQAHVLDPDWPGPRPDFRYRLVVKFTDAARVRADGVGGVRSQAAADVSRVRAVAAQHGLGFTPLTGLPPSRLEDLERRAAQRSGRAQPDLAGLHAATTPRGESDLAALERAGNALLALDVVEFAYVETLGSPPPGDIPPVTPDLEPEQDYRGPDPGIDAEFAWSLGLRGTGLTVSDCEYNWNAAHEDLVDVDLHLEPGQTPHPNTLQSASDEHGTAVLGVTSAPDNGYGVTGMAPAAEVRTYPEWTVEGGFRRVACITAAIADASPGDVVMLEMQQVGAGYSYGPAELDPAVWLVTKTGTDAGVVVVGAAGNGNQDLDHWLYEPYMAMGDSGAIIVGGGSADTQHHKYWDSTFGSRVDLQGWFVAVFTLGYGLYAEYGDDKNQRYTQYFAGTSAATPMVVSACLLVQEWAVSVHGQPLTSQELRAVLKDTAIPQGPGFPVGDFPDVKAALERVAWRDLGFALPGTHGDPILLGDGLLLAGTALRISVGNGPASTPVYLVVSPLALMAPFAGGTLVPHPDPPGLILPLATDPVGWLLIQDTWPAGVPSGSDLYLQAWAVDAGGPFGYVASNALVATTP